MSGFLYWEVGKLDKLVYGVGINDADYVTQIMETVGYTADGRQIQKLIWICPFYRKWRSMLTRCYSKNWKTKYPTYSECSAVSEWHYFMTFRAWMETQDWEGKHLDKDLLVPGNKIYGPDTCIFIDQKVNKFMTEAKAIRGDLPIGVTFDNNRGKFKALCRDVITNKQKTLGRFDTPEEANQAWLVFKLEQAKILASQQSDPIVAKALIERYTNYK